jgi:PKD repeat protein
VVTGAWSEGANGGAECTTDANGVCTIVKGNLKGNVTSVRFTVSAVTAPAAGYDSATNHDPDGDSDGTSIQVYKDGLPANQPPVADFTWSCSDLDCSFDASGSTDPDGTIVNYAWNFGDGNNGSGVTALHTYSAYGTYEVQLTVTDNEGAQDSVAQGIGVGQPAGTLHIGDLDGAASTVRNRWNVSVLITIHDSLHGAVQAATVGGTWSGGAKGDASCVTAGDGSCTVEKGNLKLSSGAVTFTVTGVEHGILSYGGTENHDPEGDSNGTAISVDPPM